MLENSSLIKSHITVTEEQLNLFFLKEQRLYCGGCCFSTFSSQVGFRPCEFTYTRDKKEKLKKITDFYVDGICKICGEKQVTELIPFARIKRWVTKGTSKFVSTPVQSINVEEVVKSKPKQLKKRGRPPKK